MHSEEPQSNSAKERKNQKARLEQVYIMYPSKNKSDDKPIVLYIRDRLHDAPKYGKPGE